MLLFLFLQKLQVILKEKNIIFFASKIQSINYNITKLPKGKGIDPQYAGTYKCTDKYRSIKIDADGSIESFYQDISEFKIPAEQITKNQNIYETYFYKTTYEQKTDVFLKIELKFSDSSHCTFRFEYWDTSNYIKKGNSDFDYIKQ